MPAGPFILGAERSHRNPGPAGPRGHTAGLLYRPHAGHGGRIHALCQRDRPQAAAPVFPGPRPLDYEQHPVTGVSWHDARAYAAWAGKRLPSEAEWEKAASWDPTTATKRRYPWGDQWDARLCNMLDTGIGHTTPAGVFSPYGDSPCGAADMAGNAFEWTTSLDWNYPYQLGDGRDDLERYGLRVRRGGGYIAQSCLCARPRASLTRPMAYSWPKAFAASPTLTANEVTRLGALWMSPCH